MKAILLIFIALTLVSCSPSETVIQTAIARTQLSISYTETALVPTPTITPTPIKATPTLGVGSSVVSKKDGMTLMYVPAGDFIMGSKENDRDASDDEKPQHVEYVEAFWIDKTEVTVSMFDKFISETDYWTFAEKQGYSLIFLNMVYGADWRHPEGNLIDVKSSLLPASHIAFSDAQAYCTWAGRRLPTDAEWEKAARGTDGRTYPWGEDFPSSEYANDDMMYIAEVGSYPKGASPYGVMDMAGNMSEYATIVNGEEGSQSHRGAGLRTASRYTSIGDFSMLDDGFRCVTDNP